MTAPSMPVRVVGADSVTRPARVTDDGEGAALALGVDDVGASADAWAPLHADAADRARASERIPKRMARLLLSDPPGTARTTRRGPSVYRPAGVRMRAVSGRGWCKHRAYLVMR